MTRALVGSLLRNFGSSASAGAAPGLAVADNGNDTGATATITGVSAGTVSVYTCRVNSSFPVAAWILSGSRSGNGTVSLNLAAGHYFAYAKTSTSAPSTLVYFQVTTGAASVEQTIIEAVQAKLVLLDLAGIDPANIQAYLQRFPTVNTIPTRPAIAVYAPKPDPSPAGTNSHDDVPYNVYVIVVDTVDVSTAAADAVRRSGWLQQIARAFRRQLLAGAPTVFDCTITPLDTPVRDNWQAHGLWVSGHVLKFTSREPRGM